MDKDYRSLEHKIRDVVTESMARNSAKRMQVTNVARPDTATDPTDVKSKIAKQGEIKTKIIDEEQLDELDKRMDGTSIISRYMARTNPDTRGDERKAGHDLAFKKAHPDSKFAKGEPKVKAVARPANEEVSDSAKKVLGDVAKKHGGQVPFKSTSYKDGKKVVTHGYNDEKGNRVVTKTTNEEAEQVDEVSSALLYRAKQAAQKKAGWLMPGDKGKGDKAWNRVKKFRDAGVKKQDQERKQALTKEELVSSVAEAYGKGYKSPCDKIEKAKPGIGKRIDAHVDALKKNAADYQAIVDKDKKKDVKEGAVPDNWEENSPQKRKATAKKVAADSMDHDKTAKIVEAAKADGVKPGDMDDSDPKKLKGGVTQVDLNPKTDDRTEDETTQDKAGKSAAAKANKEIGQKTKPVKEEAMSEKNFGLPDSLIDIVTETLKGGQKKLDKNHNGKIDGQDFKILRGETKVKAKPQYDKARPAFKEEVEQVDEATDSFHVRSVDDNDNEKMHGTHSSLDSAMSAAKKIKGAEVVQTHGKANNNGYHKIKAFHSISGKKSRPGDEDHIHPKHGLGYGGSHLTKEEVEDLEELSNKTLKSYISKANDGWHPDSTLNLAAAAANKMNSRRGKDIESAVRLRKKAEKRGEGVVKAAGKLAKEEVELSADELARIEEIAKNLE